MEKKKTREGVGGEWGEIAFSPPLTEVRVVPLELKIYFKQMDVKVKLN